MTNMSAVEALLECSVLGDISILNLNYSNLTTLPPAVFQSHFRSKLKELYAKGNKLEELPEELSLLRNLLVLHLPNNRIRFLSERISLPYSLNKLCLSSNNLTSIPESLHALPNLEVLEADRNKIKTIPASLFKLPKLRSLNLSQNSIRHIPPTVLSASNLEILLLDSNRITMLPPQICLLPRLNIISLCSNSLQLLPHDMNYLSNLSQLLVDNNPTLGYLPGSLCMLRLDILGLSECGCLYDRARDHTHIEQYNLSLKALCLNRLCQWLDTKLIDTLLLSEVFGLPTWIIGSLSIQGHCFHCGKPFYLPRAVLVTHHFKFQKVPKFKFPGCSKPVKLNLSFCSIRCATIFSQMLS